MIDVPNSIYFLSDFKRNDPEVAAQLETTGGPVVLTVNGKAKYVVLIGSRSTHRKKLFQPNYLAEGVIMICAPAVPASISHGSPRLDLVESPVDSAVANGT